MLTTLNQITPASGNPLFESALQGLGIKAAMTCAALNLLRFIRPFLARPGSNG